MGEFMVLGVKKTDSKEQSIDFSCVADGSGEC